jgi:hypothetical protein
MASSNFTAAVFENLQSSYLFGVKWDCACVRSSSRSGSRTYFRCALLIGARATDLRIRQRSGTRVGDPRSTAYNLLRSACQYAQHGPKEYSCIDGRDVQARGEEPTPAFGSISDQTTRGIRVSSNQLHLKQDRDPLLAWLLFARPASNPTCSSTTRRAIGGSHLLGFASEVPRVLIRASGRLRLRQIPL